MRKYLPSQRRDSSAREEFARRADEEAERLEADEPWGEGGPPARTEAPTPLTRLFDRLSATPHVWNIVVVACLVAGAAFALMGQMDAAFVAATIGVVAWFIEMRDRLQRPYIEAENEERRRAAAAAEEHDEKNE